MLALGGAVALTACASTGTESPPSATLEEINATRTITHGHPDSSIPFSDVGAIKESMGYSVDLCARVVEDLRRALELPDL